MKLGVVFPQTEIGSDINLIREFVQTVEELGYDYLLTFDHVLGANPEREGGWQGPYDYRHPFHEPLMLFAYAAAITSRLELTTGILILPQRQTVLVAKQAAELDLLSGGRLRLGVGAGWNAVEYEALNEDFTNRGKRLTEQIELLRRLWTQPLVDFQGRFHSIPDAGINPLPAQRPIPIWFGGHSEAAMRRMAKLGDGWIPNSYSHEKLAQMLETLRAYLKAEGRDPADFGVDYHLLMENKTPSQLAAEVETLRELGVSHVCIYTMGINYGPKEHIEAVQRFKAIFS
jgi:probable F420-dependent oxidoreductase